MVSAETLPAVNRAGAILAVRDHGVVPAVLRRLISDERVRFVVIGAVNTVVAYLLFVIFELVSGGRYLMSLFLAYALATLLAFVLHRRFTFGVVGRDKIVMDFVRFEGVYVVMFLVNAALLALLVDVLSWNSLIAQALIVIVTTTVSFVGHKFFSFRR